MYGNAGFHPMNDFIHIVMIGSFANAFLVSANHPAKSLQEFIAMAKARPGKMSFGSAGPGSAGHLTGERLKQAAGIDMQHVPYKGTGPAITDLLSGQPDAVFDGLPASTPYVEVGQVPRACDLLAAAGACGAECADDDRDRARRAGPGLVRRVGARRRRRATSWSACR